jgi:uridine phosphorylase
MNLTPEKKSSIERSLYPILEFDSTREAIIEPSKLLKKLDIAEYCVICYFQDVITYVVQKYDARKVHVIRSEIGEHPIYELDYHGVRVAFLHPCIGAPLAAGFLEELIVYGCNRFIVCGGAGVLNSEIAVGHVIVPDKALRDEGTSYHYLSPSRFVNANPKAVKVIETVLTSHNVPYVKGTTWTTDAYYRETPGKVKLRRDEGCIVVEMEAAAYFAVSEFRGVLLGQILYAGDDVGSEEWSSRDWISRTSVREKLFWLSVESCTQLDK